MKKYYLIQLKAVLSAIFLLLGSALLGQIPTNGLVTFFPFTGNTNDSSTSGTNGTASNITLTKDRFGNNNSAYAFSGNVNSYMSFSPSFVQSPTFTWSVWAKIDATPSADFQMLMEIGKGGGGYGQNLDLANNYLGQYTGFGGGGYNTTTPNFKVRKGTLPANGVWSHLCIVRDSSYMLFYIDNVLIDSHGVAKKILPSYGSPAMANVGIRSDFTKPFKGALDEVCIYNRAITKAEVKALFQNGKKSDYVASDALPEIKIYPNPTNGSVLIQWTEANKGLAICRIYDIAGNLVMENELPGTLSHNLNLGNLSSGTYVVKLFSQNQLLTTEKLLLVNER